MSRQRARKGTGTIYPRNGRFVAQADLGTRADGSRDRPTRTFDTREQAEGWLRDQHARARVASDPVGSMTVAEYLRWWLEHEAPKGKPGRAPLARTTLTNYRVCIENHLIPAFDDTQIRDLTVAALDRFASQKIAAGYAPASVNNFRGTLRSALSTPVRQDRLMRNVARYGGGVGAAPPPVEWFSTDELTELLDEAESEHFYPPIVLLARTGLRLGQACGLRWRDLHLRGDQPRLTVTWQLDKWMQLVRPKTQSARRTIPIRPEVVDALGPWRDAQARWRDRIGDGWAGEHDLVFTTQTGKPVSKRNISRRFTEVQQRTGITHGSLKTLRSTVATQLAQAGVHPRKAQAFLGHAEMSTTMKYYTAVGDIGGVAEALPDIG